jgi:hypothetical protein
LPLRCPVCPPEEAFRMLKIPGLKSKPCPNCGSKLVSLRKKKRRAREVNL